MAAEAQLKSDSGLELGIGLGMETEAHAEVVAETDSEPSLKARSEAGSES